MLGINAPVSMAIMPATMMSALGEVESLTTGYQKCLGPKPWLPSVTTSHVHHGSSVAAQVVGLSLVAEVVAVSEKQEASSVVTTRGRPREGAGKCCAAGHV